MVPVNTIIEVYVYFFLQFIPVRAIAPPPTHPAIAHPIPFLIRPPIVDQLLYGFFHLNFFRRKEKN